MAYIGSVYSLTIPWLAPDTSQHGLTKNPVSESGFVNSASLQTTTENSQQENHLGDEVHGMIHHLRDDSLAIVKPLFISVTNEDLNLENLNSQAAIKLLSQLPPFNISRPLSSIKAAPIMNFGTQMESILTSSAVPSRLQQFLSIIDSKFLQKFDLLETAVAPFVMELNKLEHSGSSKKATHIFDVLAEFWTSAATLPQLLHSTFCTFNQNLSNGYCMLIEGHKKIHMSTFPAILKKRDDSNEQITDSEDVFTSQVLRQIQNKVENAAHRFINNAEYFADDPDAFLDDFDELIDRKIIDVNRKFLRTTQRIGQLPNKVDRAIDGQIRKVAEARLDTGFEEDPNNENGVDVLNYYRGQEDSDDEDDDEDEIVYQTTVASNEMLRKRDGVVHDEHDEHDEHDITIPLSLLMGTRNIPRLKLFKNVVTQSTIGNLKKREVSNMCVPITWYNVFHNSIFGNYKFCP